MWEALTMIATQNAPAKSKHPLSRFVTPEDFALLLNLETEDLYIELIVGDM